MQKDGDSKAPGWEASNSEDRDPEVIYPGEFDQQVLDPGHLDAEAETDVLDTRHLNPGDLDP